MGRSTPTKRQKRTLGTLLEKGVIATFVGVAFLMAPLFLGASPILKSFSSALRLPGWLALGCGVMLLGVHFALKRKAEATSRSPDLAPLKREPKLVPVAAETMPTPALNGLAAIAPRAPASATTLPQPSSIWSPAVFAAIEWRRFEAVCEALFAQAGFETRSQSHGADGGVDIWLHSANAQGPAAVVQCKHWQGKAVGVKEIREFFGVMASHQLKRGTYATSSTFTADAHEFAKANGINAMDGSALLALIARRTPEQQQTLLAVAYEGEYWRPTCASCGIKMIERQPSQGGAPFWGCTNFPRCKSRLQMSTATR